MFTNTDEGFGLRSVGCGGGSSGFHRNQTAGR